MKLVLATRNQNKVVELKAAMRDLEVFFVTAAAFPHVPEVEEDQPTLEGNALKKARTLYEATGLPAMADDTGLEVAALDGRPGVYTARYAGEGCSYADNRRKMLGELQGQSHRVAQFRTVIALVSAKGEWVFEGICEGTITSEERGLGGFGYDAIFQPLGYELTFAEMDLEVKNQISHRGRAVQAFRTFLAQNPTL